MTARTRILGGLSAIIGCLVLGSAPPRAEETPQSPLTSVVATGGQDLRVWSGAIERMTREGSLRLRKIQDDPMAPGRRSERYEQYVRGVRIWGADVVRITSDGVTETVFGMVAGAVPISLDPVLNDEAVDEAFNAVAGTEGRVLSPPELVVLPLDGGGYRLCYQAVVASGTIVDRVFLDASSGSEVLRITEIKTQTPAVGRGVGVLGDQKKISVARLGSTYVTSDELRPPSIETFDMRSNLTKTKLVIDYRLPLSAGDYASDADNDWTDVAVVDAHVNLARTYDFYFKRFGRNGFDDRGHALVAIVNAVSQTGALLLPPQDFDYATSAFYCGSCGAGGQGLMYFGNGFPSPYYLTSSGQNYTYLAGGLDIVAHELTHGVTDHSSALIYRNESGALSEAFSDIMGTSVEYFYQPGGGARGQADYLIGEDVIRGVRAGALDGIRSLANPAIYGDPDHYSTRYIGTADGGGVHINSGIANNAFYLAIEGGTNRTSGRSVQGVGAANREQIEKVFYRAFVYLLPSNATFSTARAATVQAARDLYGAGSASERAVIQAWDAVGVL